MPEIRQRILENVKCVSWAMIERRIVLPVIGLIPGPVRVLTNPINCETSFISGQMLGDPPLALFGNLGLLVCVGSSMAQPRIPKPKSHWFQ